MEEIFYKIHSDTETKCISKLLMWAYDYKKSSILIGEMKTAEYVANIMESDDYDFTWDYVIDWLFLPIKIKISSYNNHFFIAFLITKKFMLFYFKP